MMRRVFLALSPGLLLLLLSPIQVSAEQVFIEASGDRQTGRGIVRESQGQCWVITPWHVISTNQIPAEDIKVIGANGVEDSADTTANLGNDIALLKMPDDNRLSCSIAWDNGKNIGSLLKGKSKATLRIADRHGDQILKAVDIIKLKKEHIFISPAVGTNWQITKGMSGSIVEIGGQAVGMVLSVVGGKNAKVIRQDFLVNLLRSRFQQKGYDDQFGIKSVKQPYWIIKNANVRAAPHKLGDRLMTIKAPKLVIVEGQVLNKPWMLVTLDNRKIGYVHTSLLAPANTKPKSVKRRLVVVQPVKNRGRPVPYLTAIVHESLSSLSSIRVIEGNKGTRSADFQVGGTITRSEVSRTRNLVDLGNLINRAIGTTRTTSNRYTNQYLVEATVEMKYLKTGQLFVESAQSQRTSSNLSANRRSILAELEKDAISKAMQQVLARISNQ